MNKDTILRLGFFGERRWLSNFHLVQIQYEGLLYPSTENAFQAAKSFDLSIREKFIDISPPLARKLGRNISLHPGWNDNTLLGVPLKNLIMQEVNEVKFKRNSHLANLLLSTGDEPLVEYNWWGDTYWGVCNGIGENHLGRILESIRSELRKVK